MIDTESYSYRKLGGRGGEPSISKRSSILFANTAGFFSSHYFCQPCAMFIGNQGDWTASVCSVGKDNAMSTK